MGTAGDITQSNLEVSMNQGPSCRPQNGRAFIMRPPAIQRFYSGLVHKEVYMLRLSVCITMYVYGFVHGTPLYGPTFFQVLTASGGSTLLYEATHWKTLLHGWRPNKRNQLPGALCYVTSWIALSCSSFLNSCRKSICCFTCAVSKYAGLHHIVTYGVTTY